LLTLWLAWEFIFYRYSMFFCLVCYFWFLKKVWFFD